MNKYTGFLLSYLKYGDNDAVLHCYTKEQGFRAFFVKGLYSSKNKKKAFLNPMNELCITVIESNAHSDLLKVTKLEPLNLENQIQDIKYNTVAFFIADFLHQVTKNEQENSVLYQEISNLKNQLYQTNYFAHYQFLVKLLEILGIAPLLSEGHYLNIVKGVFQTEMSSETSDESISKCWKAIINQQDYTSKLENFSKKKFLDSILLYYKCHFPEFRTPKSLEIINQVLE